MNLAWGIVTVHTRHPFVIARGGSAEHRVVHVRLRDDDGVEGWGEAAPNHFYGETPETATATLAQLKPMVDALDPFALDRLEAALRTAVSGNGSVRAAISAAAHDLVGKRLGVPLYRLWGLDPRDAPLSSFTIGLTTTDDELRQRLDEAAAYPVLKIKLGAPGDRDRATMRVVRERAPAKTIRVDANAAWTPAHAIEMARLLADHGVEYIEQPVAATDIQGLRVVRESGVLPVMADESCVVAADIPRLAGAVDGINLKLAKCGGLREAHRLIATARAHGMRVMAGCMIETSLGITAAAHFAALLDEADLDGAALLADDPFAGATIEGGVIAVPDGPGLGVTARAA